MFDRANKTERKTEREGEREREIIPQSIQSSASNRNEYQGISFGVNRGRRSELTDVPS
jgi:hypothetical protein